MTGGRRVAEGWTVACTDCHAAAVARSSSTQVLAVGPCQHLACSLEACG